MKSLDAICAKLAENSDSTPGGGDGNGGNSSATAGSQSSKGNKRKNFKPKLVRAPLEEEGQTSATGAEKRRKKDEGTKKEDKHEEEEEEELSNSSLVIADEDVETKVGEEGGGDDDDDAGSLQDFPIFTSHNNIMFPSIDNDNVPLTPNSSDTAFKDDLPNVEVAISGANPSLEHYITPYTSMGCNLPNCSVGSTREHFHCKSCKDSRILQKKEDMLRHYKWHRKREESLAHGFMRYSATDNCLQYFTTCPHNLRQTHYHCLHPGCDKVYISTSDVQMHASSHRKAAHIAREGFQRFKASEDCGQKDCPFREGLHRTTHFHCLRSNCNHSFKNKADMDKHKAHHLKDEQLMKDGFKKWMKNEACAFPLCPFSRALNHIHCIRRGCDYVLHSTSQMYSHKRRHEKQEKRSSSALQNQQEIGQSVISNHTAASRGPVQADNEISLGSQLNNNVGGGSKLKIKQYDPDSQQFYSPSPPPQSGTQSPDNKNIINGTNAANNNLHVAINNHHPSSASSSILPSNDKQSKPSSFSSRGRQSSSGSGPNPVNNHTQNNGGGMKIQIKHYNPMTQNFTDELMAEPSAAKNHLINPGKSSKSSSDNKSSSSSSTINNHHNQLTTANNKNLVVKKEELTLSSTRKNQMNQHQGVVGTIMDLPTGNTSGDFNQQQSGPHLIVGIPAGTDWNSAGGIDLNLFTQPMINLIPPIDDGPPIPIPSSSSSSIIIDSNALGGALQLVTSQPNNSFNNPPTSTTSTNNTSNNSNNLDSWRKYITRFTANDPCVPHCELMYKDHYHCTSGEGCVVTFRSKEGVREHARQHQLLDTACPYFAAKQANQSCAPDCPLSLSKHFHCIWEGCGERISAEEGVFRRLEHFKVHEYAADVLLNEDGNHGGKSKGKKSSGSSGSGNKHKGDGSNNNRKESYGGGSVRSGSLLDMGNGGNNNSNANNRGLIAGGMSRNSNSGEGGGLNNNVKRGRPRTVSSPRQQQQQQQQLINSMLNAASLNNIQQQQQQQLSSSMFSNSNPSGDYIDNPSSSQANDEDSDGGFTTYLCGELCPDPTCKHQLELHYHCGASRCYYSTNKSEHLENHSRDFHENLEIPEGFACFDRSFNCKFPQCKHNGKDRHFHCMRTGCTQAFIKVNSLPQHTQAVHSQDQNGDGGLLSSEDSMERMIKAAAASGIGFFPNNLMSGFIGGVAGGGAMVGPSINLGTTGMGMGAINLTNSTGPNHNSNSAAAILPALAASGLFSVEQNCGRPFCKLKRGVHYHCQACNQAFSNHTRLIPHLQKHGITIPSTATTVAPTSIPTSIIGGFPFQLPTLAGLPASLGALDNNIGGGITLTNSMAGNNSNNMATISINGLQAAALTADPLFTTATSSATNGPIPMAPSSSPSVSGGSAAGSQQQFKTDVNPSTSSSAASGGGKSSGGGGGTNNSNSNNNNASNIFPPQTQINSFAQSLQNLKASIENQMGSRNEKMKFHSFQPQSLKFTSEDSPDSSSAAQSPASIISMSNPNPTSNHQTSSNNNKANNRKKRNNASAGSNNNKSGGGGTSGSSGEAVKKFKFVDCTQDAVDAVMAANRADGNNSNTPQGYNRFVAGSECSEAGNNCNLNGLLHYHCARPGCGLPLSDLSSIPQHNLLHLLTGTSDGDASQQQQDGRNLGSSAGTSSLTLGGGLGEKLISSGGVLSASSSAYSFSLSPSSSVLSSTTPAAVSTSGKSQNNHQNTKKQLHHHQQQQQQQQQQQEQQLLMNNSKNNSNSNSNSNPSSRPTPCTSKVCTVKGGNGSLTNSHGVPVHFHCGKCSFCSGDTTKLALHVKQHAKNDQVAALGFAKVSPPCDADDESDLCDSETCTYPNQVHYHCKHCLYPCLNHQQMNVHKTSLHSNL